VTEARRALTPKQTPEERELDIKRATLTALETELAERELDLATLQATLRAFETRYVRTIGVLYRELDELKAQIAEAQARQSTHDPMLRDQAKAARARATETADATGLALRRQDDPGFDPADDLKRLYREVARRIHPDLTTDADERARRNRMMAEANRAYAAGDQTKLRAILDDWESSPESVQGEGVAAELVRTIRKIHQVEHRLADIGTAMSEMKRSELFILWRRVEAATAENRDLLADMAERLKEQIAAIRTDSMNGSFRGATA
jgi:DnaJ-domain-containing protein 1